MTHINRSPILKTQVGSEMKKSKNVDWKAGHAVSGEGVLPKCGQQGSDELINIKGPALGEEGKEHQEISFLTLSISCSRLAFPSRSFLPSAIAQSATVKSNQNFAMGLVKKKDPFKKKNQTHWCGG